MHLNRQRNNISISSWEFLASSICKHKRCIEMLLAAMVAGLVHWLASWMPALKPSYFKIPLQNYTLLWSIFPTLRQVGRDRADSGMGKEYTVWHFIYYHHHNNHSNVCWTLVNQFKKFKREGISGKRIARAKAQQQQWTGRRLGAAQGVLFLTLLNGRFLWRG